MKTRLIYSFSLLIALSFSCQDSGPIETKQVFVDRAAQARQTVEQKINYVRTSGKFRKISLSEFKKLTDSKAKTLSNGAGQWHFQFWYGSNYPYDDYTWTNNTGCSLTGIWMYLEPYSGSATSASVLIQNVNSCNSLSGLSFQSLSNDFSGGGILYTIYPTFGSSSSAHDTYGDYSNGNIVIGRTPTNSSSYGIENEFWLSTDGLTLTLTCRYYDVWTTYSQWGRDYDYPGRPSVP